MHQQRPMTHPTKLQPSQKITPMGWGFCKCPLGLANRKLWNPSMWRIMCRFQVSSLNCPTNIQTTLNCCFRESRLQPRWPTLLSRRRPKSLHRHSRKPSNRIRSCSRPRNTTMSPSCLRQRTRLQNKYRPQPLNHPHGPQPRPPLPPFPHQQAQPQPLSRRPHNNTHQSHWSMQEDQPMVCLSRLTDYSHRTRTSRPTTIQRQRGLRFITNGNGLYLPLCWSHPNSMIQRPQPRVSESPSSHSN